MIWFWVPALLNASPFLFSLVQCDVTGEKEEQPGVDAEVAATSKRRNSLLWPFGGRRGGGRDVRMVGCSTYGQGKKRPPAPTTTAIHGQMQCDASL